LTDTFTDGSPIRLFESGSIMQYLVDRYDPDHKVSYPRDSREYYETNNWVSIPQIFDNQRLLMAM
jgi:glutathione S-transferase